MKILMLGQLRAFKTSNEKFIIIDSDNKSISILYIYTNIIRKMTPDYILQNSFPLIDYHLYQTQLEQLNLKFNPELYEEITSSIIKTDDFELYLSAIKDYLNLETKQEINEYWKILNQQFKSDFNLSLLE